MARVLVMASAAVWTALAGCGSPRPAAAPAPERAIETISFAPVLEIDLAKYTKTKSGAYYFDMVRGTGPAANIDRRVSLKYVVFLPSGVAVESQKSPVSITLGPNVIRGWRDALPGMRVGGVRRLILPPALAYGRAAYGAIPANSTLVFEVELLGVQ